MTICIPPPGFSQIHPVDKYHTTYSCMDTAPLILGKFIDENKQKLATEDDNEDCNDSFHSFLTSCSSNDSTIKNNMSSTSRPGKKKLESVSQQQDGSYNQSNQSSDNLGLTLSKDQLQEYENIFQTMKDALGVKNIDEMISKYLQNEEQNFSLFSYISYHNGEITKLESEIDFIQQEIINATCREQSMEARYQKQMKEEAQKSIDLNNKAKDYECKFNSNFKMLKQLNEELDRINNMLPTDTFEASDKKTNVTKEAHSSVEKEIEGTGAIINRVFESLGHIESKITTFVTKNETSTAKTNMSSATERRGSVFPNKIDLSFETLFRSHSLSVTPISLPMKNTLSISIHPPSTEYSSGEDDEYLKKDEESERPFTLDELRQSTMAKIQEKRYSKKVLLTRKQSRR